MQGASGGRIRAAHGGAATVLAALVVLSPWPFGSVLAQTTRAIVLVCLLTAAIVLAGDRAAGGRAVASLPVWPLAGILALALLQLVPAPAPVHQVVAAGSAAVWHPTTAAAAEVLGWGSHPLSIHPAATGRWALFTLALGAITLAAAPALGRRRAALRLTVTLVTGGLAVATYGLVARLSLGNRVFGLFAVPTVAPFGPFVSKNHFAGYVEGLALLALGLAVGLADEARRADGALGWAVGGRGSRVVWAGGAAAALALAVAVSLSRGGVVAIAAGATALLALRQVVRRRGRTRRGLAVAAASLALTAAIGFSLLPGEARDRIRGISAARDEVSGSYRLGLWGDTMRLAAASPLVGHGFGAYEDALPRFKTIAGELQVEHAENDWLELAAEGGALALGLVVVLVVLALRQIVRGLRAQPDRLLRGIGLGASAGALALLAHSFVDFNLRIPSNALVFAGLVALAAGTALPAGAAEHDAPERGGGRARLALLALLSLGVLATLWVPWSEPPGQMSRLRRAATRPEARLRRTASEEWLLGHLRSRPADAPAWAWLAWVRRMEGSDTARELAAHAVWLDPRRPGFAEALRGLTGPTEESPGRPPTRPEGRAPGR